jgi:cell division protease FtsH
MDSQMERKDHINFWYAILAFVAVLFIQSYWLSAQHTETIPYSKFDELLKAGAIKDIAISNSAITGTLKAPAENQKPHFAVVRVDPGFAETLSRYGVEFTGVSDNTFPGHCLAGRGCDLRRQRSEVHGSPADPPRCA